MTIAKAEFEELHALLERKATSYDNLARTQKGYAQHRSWGMAGAYREAAMMLKDTLRGAKWTEIRKLHERARAKGLGN